MRTPLWLDLLQLAFAFAFGMTAVYKLSRGSRRRTDQVAAFKGPATGPAPTPRPQQQIALQSFEALVATTDSAVLLGSIERRTRLSTQVFKRDCLPVLETFADFVQMLPASESHHHAQPGGLWIHALEVVDAALTFRAGMELPAGASTEERKRLEHRCTFAVFAAALLHDVGKPVTDVKVLLYGADPRAGRPWTPMAGSMRTFDVGWYSVSFANPSERDYKAHSKLPAVLLHAFVQPRVMRWLAEEGDVLAQLLAYLSGEDADGSLGSIVKRADSDSVRRNLLHATRTRFSSARTRPLIERLMEALRRMLHEGAVLPLNRPGAAGWVYEDRVWFVCARLADEVRTYLAQHESGTGIPGKDRNDRLFDTWQEHGAVEPAADGGAIWRVRVECDGWSPPDLFTVLAFPLDKLYPPGATRPQPMRGRVWVPGPAAAASAPAAPGAVLAASNLPQASPVKPSAAAANLPDSQAAPVAVPHAAPAAASAAVPARHPSPIPAPAIQAQSQATPELTSQASAEPAGTGAEPEWPAAAAVDVGQATGLVAAEVFSQSQTSAAVVGAPVVDPDSDLLDPTETAHQDLMAPRATTTPELGAPLRPKERHVKVPGSLSTKGPSPAATALMAWVANGVGSGAIKYNEEGAPVHFVREGALLLTPEVFRRFLSEHDAVPDGPIAALRASHGERAFARLQNELAKSGWAVRHGDENVHPYAFVKADKQLSRAASFFLIGRPDLFWNPVPEPNDRIRPAPRPKKMELPGAGKPQGTQGREAANTHRSTV